MKRIVVLLAVALSLTLALAQCGVKQEGKNDAPAGQPDELKDSTRLDAAPDTSHKEAEAQSPK